MDERKRKETTKKEIEIVAIVCDEWTTRFMQGADMFEKFKVCAVPQRIIGTLKEGETPATVCCKIKAALEKGLRVVAVFVPGIAEGAWADESVKVVSDGEKWCPLVDMLQAYGWKGKEIAA